MLDPFFAHIQAIHPVTDGLRDALLRNTEIITLPRHTHILREGQRSDHVHMVLQGLMRSYYIKDGQEICSRFMAEGHVIISVNSFYTRKAGYEFIETLEDTVIARLHYDALQRIYRDHPEYNFIVRVLTEHYFALSEQRLYLLRKQSAEERYLFFLENYPALLQRIPLKYIATFLGMNLETLSRIRKKISR